MRPSVGEEHEAGRERQAPPHRAGSQFRNQSVAPVGSWRRGGPILHAIRHGRVRGKRDPMRPTSVDLMIGDQSVPDAQGIEEHTLEACQLWRVHPVEKRGDDRDGWSRAR